jgi:hypothetical protein
MGLFFRFCKVLILSGKVFERYGIANWVNFTSDFTICNVVLIMYVNILLYKRILLYNAYDMKHD